VSTGANALTFNALPVKQTSKQWAVQVDEAIGGKDSVKPEKGKFHTYSLEVDNIGKNVLSAEINFLVGSILFFISYFIIYYFIY
jgi:hypothetical protein